MFQCLSCRTRVYSIDSKLIFICDRSWLVKSEFKFLLLNLKLQAWLNFSTSGTLISLQFLIKRDQIPLWDPYPYRVRCMPDKGYWRLQISACVIYISSVLTFPKILGNILVCQFFCTRLVVSKIVSFSLISFWFSFQFKLELSLIFCIWKLEVFCILFSVS